MEERIRTPHRRDVSYGSFSVVSGHVEELLHDIQDTVSISMSSSDDEEDEDHGVVSLLIHDLEAPTGTHAHYRGHTTESTFHQSFLVRSSVLGQPFGPRRVSFQQQSVDQHPNFSALNPSKHQDFRQAWKRKSLRRISAILSQSATATSTTAVNSNNEPKNTAKEHWAILRNHVVSGQFFLDHDRATMNPNSSSVNTRIRHSKLARNLKAELRGGLEFDQWTMSLCHCRLFLNGRALL
jgi:hypothetical protein